MLSFEYIREYGTKIEIVSALKSGVLIGADSRKKTEPNNQTLLSF